MPEVLILSGPSGAGKSSVAAALADRYDRVAHLPADIVHDFITPTGHVHPWGPQEAWQRQRRLLTRAVCASARVFLDGRFAVIIDDVVVSAAELQQYIGELKDAGMPVHYVRLMPSLEVCLQRNAARGEGERLRPQRVETVYRELEAAGEFAGKTIDSSNLSIEATADRLQALTTAGESIVWAPET